MHVEVGVYMRPALETWGAEWVPTADEGNARREMEAPQGCVLDVHGCEGGTSNVVAAAGEGGQRKGERA
jgi:hypothetical protein